MILIIHTNWSLSSFPFLKAEKFLHGRDGLFEASSGANARGRLISDSFYGFLDFFSLGSHSPLSRGIRATGAQGPAAGGREAARRVLGAAPRVRAPLLAVSDLRRYSRYQARRDRRGAGDRSLDRPS